MQFVSQAHFLFYFKKKSNQQSFQILLLLFVFHFPVFSFHFFFSSFFLSPASSTLHSKVKRYNTKISNINWCYLLSFFLLSFFLPSLWMIGLIYHLRRQFFFQLAFEGLPMRSLLMYFLILFNALISFYNKKSI